MDGVLQPSLIPKKSLAPAALPPRRRSAGVISLIAGGLFLASVGAYAVGFAYKALVEKSIGTLNDSLSRARTQFEADTLSELTKTDAKINAATELLGSHVTLQPLFNLLEQSTLQSVRFKNFHLNNDEQKGYLLRMSGEARGLPSMALQSDAYGATKKIKDAVFVDFKRDLAGLVTFNFSATLEPSLFSYRNLVEGGTTPAPTPVVSTTTQP